LSGRDGCAGSELICSIPVLLRRNKLTVDPSALDKVKDLHTLPWTQIYSPTQANDVIGNSSPCTALVQWLKSWKRIPHTPASSTAEKRRTEKDPDFIPDYDSFKNGSTNEDSTTAAMVIWGPHGCGKTAAVYACASQVGFKVMH